MVAGSYTVAGVVYGWRTASLTATNPRTAGSYNIRATATDNVGNATTSPNTPTNVVVDNTNPTGTVTAPANGGFATASTTVTSNSADATAGVYSAAYQYSPAGAGSWTSIATDTVTPFSVSWNTTGLTDGGSYDLRVITTDNASNTSTSATVTVTIDRTAPNAPSTPLLAPASDGGAQGDNRTNDDTPTMTGTAEAGSTVKLYDGVTQVGTATATGGNWSITASTLATGAHTMTATATDLAGNPSVSSGSVVVTIDTTQSTVTGAVIANGPNIAGKVDAGDTGTITFSEQMNATTFCSIWTNSGTQTLTNVTVTILDGFDNLGVTTASCAMSLGTWLVGDYVDGNATFTNSTVSWNPATFKITVTLGTLGTFTTLKTGVSAALNEYTGSPPLTDLAGNAIVTTKFTAPAPSGF